MSPPTLTKRDVIVDAVVAGLLLLLAFAAFAVSDVSVGPTRTLWTVLVAALLAASLLFTWRRTAGDGPVRRREMAVAVAHWVGVLVAVHLVFFLSSTGRFANADTGLACSAVVALGAYLAGLRGDWVLVAVGVAAAAGTAAAALIEQYVWVLAVIAVLAVALVFLVGRVRARRGVAEA